MARMSNLQEKIIEATIQEISQGGIENLTTKKISKSAKTSTGIIHHHFSTKSNLILATYTKLIDDLTAKRDAVRSQYPNDPALRIEATAMISFNDDYINDDNARAWTQLWASAMCNKKIGKILSEHNKNLLNMIEGDFKEFCDAKSARQHALSVTAMIHGYWVELQIAKNVSMEECNHAIKCCVENARRKKV